jgi:thiopeptide-type bacteriocin biosynthesis protein
MSRPARYVALSPVLVRAPTLPVDAYLALPPDAADEQVSDPLVRTAVAVASPDLLDGIDHPSPGRAERAASAVLRYRIRMSTRPTPFGLFAGVGLAALGDRTTIHLRAEGLRTRTRPDMAWLLALVAEAEARLAVRRELRVLTNPMAWECGGRFLLAERAAVDGGGETRSVDVRATGAVRRALALARRPITWRDLTADLAAATGAGEERVERLLTQLWQQTFLLTDLRPPLTHQSPARYVEQRLAAIDAASADHRALISLLDRMTVWDALPMADRPAALRDLCAGASRTLLAREGSPAQVDTALPLAGAIGRRVGDAVVAAVELLLRLGPASLTGGLEGYRQAFSSRYGADREVALLELLDPERGLGPPSRYGSGPTVDAEAEAARRAWLRTTAAEALRTRRLTVRLKEPDVARLAGTGPPPDLAPISVDLSCFVLAGSAEEVDFGDFRLLIGPNLGAQAAGRTLGRFADLLGPDGSRAAVEVAAAVRDRQPGRLHAELVYLPRRPRAANVAVRPQLHDHEVMVSTSPGVDPQLAIPLSELLVGVRGDRFYLRWPEAPGDLVVHAGHMLNPRGAPEACRFVEEVSRDERAPLSGFGWAAAGDLPFLPRLEIGPIVLAPAQWRIDVTVRDRHFSGDDGDVYESLAAWRSAWLVPRHVYLAAGDNRLLVDLEAPAQADLLVGALRRLTPDDVVVLHEPLPGPEHAWLTGPDGRYLPELVVSVVQRSRAAHFDAPTRGATEVSRDERFRALGSDWLFAKLYGPVSGQDELLAGPVRRFAEFATSSGLATRWFFLRYADPDPHLRLRFAGEPADLMAGLLPRLSEWTRSLLGDGSCDRIAFDTYEREIERYGGPSGLAVTEQIFAVDSVTTIELLALGHDPGDPTVAVLSVDSLLAALGLGRARRAAVYRSCVVDRHESGAEYRERQRALRPLLGTHDGADLDPEGALARLLRARDLDLHPLGQRLHHLERAGELGASVDHVCRSLIHLHCNRLLSRSGPSEQRVLGLALRTVESLLAAPLPPTDDRQPG